MFRFYSIMKVLSLNNNVNFTSTPLHRVNLINAKDGSFIPAIFSKLNKEDAIDKEALEHIMDTWNSSLAHDYYYNFRNNNHLFNAIELLGSEKLEERIVGLAESNSHNLFLLITKPKLSEKNKINRQIKNIGEKLLGEIFSQSKNAKADYLDFEALKNAVDFYKKSFERAGIKYTSEIKEPKHINSEVLFSINQDQFNKYINYIKKKFEPK